MANKATKNLLKELTQAGWTIKETKKGVIVYPPNKNLPGVTIHMTPSDNRAWANMIATLRRSGYTN